MLACGVFLYLKWWHLHCHAREQVRLLLEFMDLGTLREALDRHVFFYKPPYQGLDYCSVLDTAADIAKGLLHLHSLNIIHGDLKVCTALNDWSLLVQDCGGYCQHPQVSVSASGITQLTHLCMHHNAPAGAQRVAEEQRH